jgi:ABC-type nitrate/sulfonate/bicarbonate transport system substrate-binding protein
LNKVIFGTNWIVQAEYGGFDQALATGIYKDHGLDVSVKMGRLQVPGCTQLLMGSGVGFFMGRTYAVVTGKRERGAAGRRVLQSRSVSLDKDTKDTFAQRLAEKSRGFQRDFA